MCRYIATAFLCLTVFKEVAKVAVVVFVLLSKTGRAPLSLRRSVCREHYARESDVGMGDLCL